jgi:glycosyltransferase involved in cell wall biosynthesis
MASGIPVVQPALGAFPEITEKSRGGVTYSPNTPNKLSETWAELFSNPEKLKKLSRDGYDGTKKYFNIHNHAAEIIGLYESLRLSKSS